MPALVSVVMPVRNGGEFLAGAVDSILSQTHEELELIVVDDHSADRAIDDLPRTDDRLSFARSTGRGVSAAFNTGLTLARGDYIARMDADDIALATRLEAQLDHLREHPELAICGGCVEIFSDTGLQDGYRRYQEWLNACRDPETIHREIFIESPIPNPTALFRREAIDTLVVDRLRIRDRRRP